jgi:squalene synthase HpnC
VSGWNFADELARWGPNAAQVDVDFGRRYCRDLARTHYENFPVLTWFVPKALRQHFANVYAYCRWSDDLADEVGDAGESLRLLNWWQGELLSCYGEAPKHPITVALKETIEEFAIPSEPFLDLLSAFRRDQTQTRYESFDDLLDYCRQSANPVGRLVLYLARRTDERFFDLSDSICTGLQLANFWQDVAIDWRKGRVYLPQEDLRRYEVGENDLAARIADKNVRELLRFQVERAEHWLKRGRPLASMMPGRMKVVVALFAEGGLGILRKIRTQHFDVLSARPKLGKADYIGIAQRAMGTAFLSRKGAVVR